MKNKILVSISFLVVIALMFSACEKPPVEEANENYNYDNIIPKIFNFTGPTALPASGLGYVEYSCIVRGGSTYSFTTEGQTATIVIKEGHPNVAQVTWDQSDVDVAAKIFVVETTLGGKTSAPDTLDVALSAFKPLPITAFYGTLTGTDEEGWTTFSSEAGPGENQILITGLFGATFAGWGETFQAGHGNDGKALAQIDLETGTVVIDHQYWGQTLPGPYDYWIWGGGSWDGVSNTMTITYSFCWASDCTYKTFTTTFTLP